MFQKVVYMGISLVLTVSSCSENRTYLTEDEMSWNPYVEGEILIFESSNYRRDTIYIEETKKVFPDGLGVITYNERLRILAKHSYFKYNKYISTYILSIVANTEKNDSYIEFGIKANNAQFIEGQRFSFDELNELPEREFAAPFGTLNDVIVIGNKKNYSNIPTAIEIIYWSKSRGYLGFDKYDGTSWRLVKIIEPKNEP